MTSERHWRSSSFVYAFILQIEGLPKCCSKWPLYFEVCYCATVDKDCIRSGILSSVSSLLIWFSQLVVFRYVICSLSLWRVLRFPWLGPFHHAPFSPPLLGALFYWWQVFNLVRVLKIQGMLKPKIIKNMISLKSQNSMLCQIPQLWEYIYPFVTVFRF